MRELAPPSPPARRFAAFSRVKSADGFFTTESAEGNGKRSLKERRGIRVRLYGFVAHSCEAVLIRVKSWRAKNLNRTHVCRTSVAEPRKPCFTPQQAKIRRETGTLPFTLLQPKRGRFRFLAQPRIQSSERPSSRAGEKAYNRPHSSVGWGLAASSSSADFRAFRSKKHSC